MTEDIIDRSDVERVLADLRFEVPEADAAHTAAELDTRMERLHREVHGAPARERGRLAI